MEGVCFDIECDKTWNLAPTATPTKLNVAKFTKECIDEHNRLRHIHGCSELTCDRKLCEYASEWAREISKKKTLNYRKEGKYGENIIMIQGLEIDGDFPVKQWYDEIEAYNFNKPGFAYEIGHFSQVIWKESKKIGVGVCQRGHTIWVVVNYDPPGNYLMEFEHNVPMPKRIPEKVVCRFPIADINRDD